MNVISSSTLDKPEYCPSDVWKVIQTHLITSITLVSLNQKKDMRDKCDEHKYNTNPSENQLKDYADHMKRKQLGVLEQGNDRSKYKLGNGIRNQGCVVTFDFENVFSLPKA
ncbi:hypothetical protein ILUMI_18576 [Ignelater luminosus]|uniref:Uncharacterized protein n=1 Tax=Ignelater luminosus TaxID=2038154 RepID=A0A8K0CLU0_IGNLU|nr:hypothetical protein ILUMI_18576 [Ignelater luminosus]